MAVSLMPRRHIRSQMAADLLDTCSLLRNEGLGDGWVTLAILPCSKEVPMRQPAPGDPTEATDTSAEVVQFKLAHGSAGRIGDKVAHNDELYTVGATNQGATYGAALRLQAARPTAATVRQEMTFFRPDGAGGYTTVQTVVVQTALANSQPDRSTPGERTITGWVFAVDGEPPLAVQPGDVFDYAGQQAQIQYVTPDPDLRREATFQVNLGNG